MPLAYNMSFPNIMASMRRSRQFANWQRGGKGGERGERGRKKGRRKGKTILSMAMY
jgi:hypothetical protein